MKIAKKIFSPTKKFKLQLKKIIEKLVEKLTKNKKRITLTH